jgi:hypothetical protein
MPRDLCIAEVATRTEADELVQVEERSVEVVEIEPLIRLKVDDTTIEVQRRSSVFFRHAREAMKIRQRTTCVSRILNARRQNGM